MDSFRKSLTRVTTKSREIPGKEGASLEVGVVSANKEGSNSSISEKKMECFFQQQCG